MVKYLIKDKGICINVDFNCIVINVMNKIVNGMNF